MEDKGNAKGEQANEKDAAKEQSDDKKEVTSLTKTTKEAYFEQLEAWVKMANFSQNAMGMFPWYLWNVFQSGGMGAPPHNGNGAYYMPFGQMPYTQAQQQQSPSANNNVPLANNNNNNNTANGGIAGVPFVAGLRILDSNGQTALIQRNGGYEYVIAPFWKRAMAEIIDSVLLMIIKVLLTFMLMNFLEIDWAIDLDKEVLRKAYDEDDYTNFFIMTMNFLAFSTDLIMLELSMKALVCLYEAFMIHMCGCTFGKSVMKIRVYYVEAVLPLPQAQPQPAGPIQFQPLQGFPTHRGELRALIQPGTKPNFKRALIRTIVKNIIIMLLFPMCFIMVFFKNNRAAYDILTKTVVVEHNPEPVLRFPLPAPAQAQPQQ